MTVATVSAKGWVVIPKAFRTEFNLKPGTKVRFVAYAGGIHMFPVSEDPISEMQGMFADGPSMIDDLLADHQAEVERDEEEFSEALRSG